jgi:hypothetical protein
MICFCRCQRDTPNYEASLPDTTSGLTNIVSNKASCLCHAEQYVARKYSCAQSLPTSFAADQRSFETAPPREPLPMEAPSVKVEPRCPTAPEGVFMSLPDHVWSSRAEQIQYLSEKAREILVQKEEDKRLVTRLNERIKNDSRTLPVLVQKEVMARNCIEQESSREKGQFTWSQRLNRAEEAVRKRQKSIKDDYIAMQTAKERTESKDGEVALLLCEISRLANIERRAR